MKIGMYGASDDLVEIQIDGKSAEEFGCCSGKIRMVIRDDHLTPGLVVTMWHDGYRGWLTKIGFTKDHDDGDRVPCVDMSLSETGYSMLIEIRTTDSPSVVWFKDREKIARVVNGKVKMLVDA